jgi:hypothetical protein
MDSTARAALIYLWAPFANLFWYAETIVMGTISLLVWPFDRNGEMQHMCARWWCRMVAGTIGARIRVHGVEQLQAGRAYVYVANHSSLIDTPALFVSLPYQFKNAEFRLTMRKTGTDGPAGRTQLRQAIGQLHDYRWRAFPDDAREDEHRRGQGRRGAAAPRCLRRSTRARPPAPSSGDRGRPQGRRNGQHRAIRAASALAAGRRRRQR